ncbi:ABC transporter ATP-binding protein [Chengkuizengella axinellae]|uniref:ABC transporter ATP-binding protein n=1 Tax=Chengkuizengella axinellae TaxID=3064388 RepID=A0ABT9IWC7_9BACL|nr:ABC transporter ATP-binding protein [Chengkuizengella sp. 2205SS18-9]MDP5273119.1 ABC transporter ATP-binding protein [Chengkuizengella sp. 2205SS18-9]
MIEINNLTKKYGNFTALNNLNLNISTGTVFGFVGPNGAGKSTTMSILATLLSPTTGSAKVGGYEVTKHPKEVRKLIGYMPDFFGVYDHFKTVEYLDFYGASYGIPRNERLQVIPQLLELVNLSDKKDFYVDSLSRGMKQRLCLARSLIHDPELLILDEPASGLDPRARIEMREILKELKTMGKTIMISSHILPELAEMVDEIGVIENGVLVSQGKVSDIQNQLSSNRILNIRILENKERAMEQLRDEKFVAKVEADEKGLQVHFSGEDKDQFELLSKLMADGHKIVSYSEAEADLEDVFLAITKGA